MNNKLRKGKNIPIPPVWGSIFEVNQNITKKGKLILKKGVKYLINGMAKNKLINNVRDEYWILFIKDDLEIPEKYILKKDINKLYDRGMIIKL